MRRRWQCGKCGRTLRAPIECRVLFHKCTPPPRHRRLLAMPTVDQITTEEMRSALWRDAFERAVGGDDDVMLRRL